MVVWRTFVPFLMLFIVCPMRTNGVSQQETIEDDNEESDGYDTDSSNEITVTTTNTAKLHSTAMARHKKSAATSTHDNQSDKPGKSKFKSTTFRSSSQPTTHSSESTFSDLSSTTFHRDPGALDKSGDTDSTGVIVAVALSVAVFTSLVIALGFFLYRRWPKRSNERTINSATVAVTVEDSMPVASDNDSTHYYSIKDEDVSAGSSARPEEKVSNSETGNTSTAGEYSTISENVKDDYNKISFKPKLVPNDPNHEHSTIAGNVNLSIYNRIERQPETRAGSARYFAGGTAKANDTVIDVIQNPQNDNGSLSGTTDVINNVRANDDSPVNKMNLHTLEQTASRGLANLNGTNSDIYEQGHVHDNIETVNTGENEHTYFVLDKETLQSGSQRESSNMHNSSMKSDSDSRKSMNQNDHTYFILDKESSAIEQLSKDAE